MIDAVMYGMMPRAKMVSRRSWPPLNRSTKPRNAAAVLVEELRQLVGVDTRRRDVSAEAVHRQQPKREQNALSQIGNAEYVG